MSDRTSPAVPSGSPALKNLGRRLQFEYAPPPIGPSVPEHRAEPMVLADGTRVLVRPMTFADGPRLRRFHSTLSVETTRLRFFSVHPQLSDREVDRFTHVDHAHREALVVVDGDEIVAVGRYEGRPGSDTAEVAFVVADDWQGRGLAPLLLRRLIAMARSQGIRQFDAVTLPENSRMLHVFRASGLPVSTRFDRDGVAVTIDLTGDSAGD